MAAPAERRSKRLQAKQAQSLPQELSPQKPAKQGPGRPRKAAQPPSSPAREKKQPQADFWKLVQERREHIISTGGVFSRPCPPDVKSPNGGGQTAGVAASGAKETATPLLGLLQARSEAPAQARSPACRDIVALPALPASPAAPLSPPPPARAPHAGAAAAPWRVDVNSERPLPRPPAQPLACWRRDEPCWRAAEVKAGEDCPFRRWVRRAEACAARHVKDAFGRIERHLVDVARRPGDGDLRCVLALAGPDGADHDAAMRQAEQLIRARLHSAHVALVGPEDLQSPALATRQLCSQLMRGAPPPESEDPEEAEAEDGQDVRVPAGAGMMDYIDWRRQQGAGGPVALLVARADAAPKAALREALGCWGAACREGGVPALVVLGLQQPPQSRFGLLEGEPLVPLRLLEAVNLFDSQKACAQMLEQLMSDEQCPLPLPPEMFPWLWELFSENRRSVHHTLKALALLCERLRAESPVAALAGLLRDAEEPPQAPGKGSGGAQHARLQRARRALREHLQRAEWPEACRPLLEGTPAEAEKRLSEAMRELQAWWKRLSGSLTPWDLLLQRAEPLAKHEPRLRRLCRLLLPLCPTEGEEEEDGAAAEEMRMGGELGRKCFELLQGSSRQLPPESLQELLADLLMAGDALDPSLQVALRSLCERQLEGEQLREGLKHFFIKLRFQKWYTPLTGDARALFVSLLPAARELPRQLERRLACGEASAADGLLSPLSRQASGPMADAALLHRIMEAAPGKSLAVRELWQAFSVQLQQAGGRAERVQGRFGHALVALQMMGLHAARSGSSEPGEAFRGWRLRRRHFGRAWLRRRKQPAERPQWALAAQAPETPAPAEPLPLPDLAAPPQRPRLAPWCMWSGARALQGASSQEGLLPGRGVKRPLGPAPRQQMASNAAKRAKKAGKQRVRMFMG